MEVYVINEATCSRCGHPWEACVCDGPETLLRRRPVRNYHRPRPLPSNEEHEADLGLVTNAGGITVLEPAPGPSGRVPLPDPATHYVYNEPSRQVAAAAPSRRRWGPEPLPSNEEIEWELGVR